MDNIYSEHYTRDNLRNEMEDLLERFNYPTGSGILFK